MRRAALLCSVLALAWAPAAAAAPPTVTATTSVRIGSAPLEVVLTATGDAVSYEWDLGDGTRAEGASVRHTYAEPGRYRAIVTGFSAEGEPATAAMVISAFRLTLEAPRTARYRAAVRYRGRLVPAAPGAVVRLVAGGRQLARVRTRADGSFRVRTRVHRPGAYAARWGVVASPKRMLRLQPQVDARLIGDRTVGGRLAVAARATPQAAGRVVVRVLHGGAVVRRASSRGSIRIVLPTGHAGNYRVTIALRPARGYTRAGRALTTTVVQPDLSLGSRGPSVRVLEQRLAELHYALPEIDTVFGLETYQAVLAFQKVEGLHWTGSVDAEVWQRLARASIPRARYPGSHIEVSKSRQVLYLVRDGLVQRVVHVSTGATGNTPVGRWYVYHKVPGWDWVLWYPMYFLRGFAIHGYPSVPAYPASHGCVRVPMWIATQLYAANPYGTTIYVY
jgi:L,D-transpeptidase catalytic domain/PKD domain/Putative peptidoglycan binding domain